MKIESKLACARASAGQFWRGEEVIKTVRLLHPITRKSKKSRVPGTPFGAETVLSTVCTVEAR